MATLERRGVTKDERKRAKDLVHVIETTAAPQVVAAPPPPTDERMAALTRGLPVGAGLVGLRARGDHAARSAPPPRHRQAPPARGAGRAGADAGAWPGHADRAEPDRGAPREVERDDRRRRCARVNRFDNSVVKRRAAPRRRAARFAFVRRARSIEAAARAPKQRRQSNDAVHFVAMAARNGCKNAADSSAERTPLPRSTASNAARMRKASSGCGTQPTTFLPRRRLFAWAVMTEAHIARQPRAKLVQSWAATRRAPAGTPTPRTAPGARTSSARRRGRRDRATRP